MIYIKGQFYLLLSAVRLLFWKMKKIIKNFLNLFKSSEKSNLNSIEDLRALKLRKEKIEKEIKSRAYISEINKRYNKMKDKKRKNFFRKAS